MYFTIDSTEFRKLVQTVAPALQTGRFVELPAYTCIKIEAIDDGIVLQACSDILSIQTVKGTPVTRTGAIGVPGKYLSQIAAIMPEGELTIKATDGRATITNSKTKFDLHSTNPELFPVFPDYKNLDFVMTDSFFQQADRVKFATSTDPDRGIIQGICVRDKKLIATDGHRLAISPHNLPFNDGTVIHADSITKLSKVFNTDEMLQISVGDAEIHFHQGNVMATSRLLEGKYPDYTQVIPKTPYDEISFPKEQILSTLKILNIVVDKEFTTYFDFQPGRAKVTSQTAEVGEAEDYFECQTAKPFKNALNSKYLIQTLERLEQDVVTMQVRDPNFPVVIKEGEYVHVIMPKRRPSEAKKDSGDKA